MTRVTETERTGGRRRALTGLRIAAALATIVNGVLAAQALRTEGPTWGWALAVAATVLNLLVRRLTQEARFRRPARRVSRPGTGRTPRGSRRP